MPTRAELPSPLPLGLVPRLLNRNAAAAYCGISPNHFDVNVAPHVEPVPIGSKRLWDRKAIVRWIDRKSGMNDAGDLWNDAMGQLE